MNLRHFFIFCLAGMAAVACSEKGDEPTVTPGAEETEPTYVESLDLTPAESRAAAELQGFATDFLSAANAEYTGKNLVVSPLSASTLLAMLANAASDEVAQEITTALGCSDLDALNSLSNKSLTLLPFLDADVEIAFANALWYKNSYTLAPTFSNIMAEHYNAAATSLPSLSTVEAMETINKWADGKTEGLIPKILTSPLDESTLAIIANAQYFNGKWTVPFDKSRTENHKFKGISSEKEIPMMNMQAAQFAYTPDDGSYQAVKLNYGKGAFSAYFILPLNKDIDSFISAGLCAEALKGEYTSKNIKLALPAFKIAADEPLSLNKTLGALGIPSLSKCLPSHIFTEQLELAYTVYQKNSIEFDESGSEGASVTWSQIDGASSSPANADVDEIVFDRPFIFFITEAETGACLFAGKVADIL